MKEARTGLSSIQRESEKERSIGLIEQIRPRFIEVAAYQSRKKLSFLLLNTDDSTLESVI